MLQEFEETLKSCQRLTQMGKRDFEELRFKRVDERLFESFENQRLINSFLFSYIKLQDIMGAKLFKKLLYLLGEIDSLDVAFVDILSKLEKLEILTVEEWKELRSLRNIVAHEYPFDVASRIESLEAAMQGFVLLQRVLKRVEDAIAARRDRLY